ncbi:MAG: hypothetical protein WBP72_12975 [Rhodocyclaceae bacterium]
MTFVALSLVVKDGKPGEGSTWIVPALVVEIGVTDNPAHVLVWLAADRPHHRSFLQYAGADAWQPPNMGADQGCCLARV